MKTILIDNKEFQVYNFDEIDQTKYRGFIYVTINKINSKKYIGQHTRFHKNYLGSGKTFMKAVDKYGKENFRRYIINLAKTQDELDSLEENYINNIFNAAKDKNWYNIKSGSQRGGGWHLEGKSEEERKEIYKKISEKLKKRFANKKHPSYGRKHTEETKKKIKENRPDLSGEKNPFYGKKHDEETRKKMKGKRESMMGEKNPNYGKGRVDYHSCKKVMAYYNGELFGEFPSIFEFAKEFGSNLPGDAIYSKCRRLANGWIPVRGKLVGWSARIVSTG